MLDFSHQVSEARPAATVIVVRDSAVGLEVLLLKRNDALKHMPGLWVFPGGKVEATDPGVDELEQARHAASRELQEESDIVLDPEVLQPFSHWLTPVVVSRRFATWFFLGDVTGDQMVRVDGSEIIEHQWLSPSTAVAMHQAGTLPLTPPTLVSLHDIEHSADVASLNAAMQGRSALRFFPNVVREGERMVFLYEGDVAYESGDLGNQGPVHRTTGEGGIFHYHVANELSHRDAASDLDH